MIQKEISNFLRRYSITREVFLLTSVGLATFISTLMFDWVGGLIGFGVSAALFLLIEVLGFKNRVVITEREIGILFDNKGNFEQFLAPGTYDIWRKDLKVRVPNYKQRAEDRFDHIRTREGILVSVKWATEYTIDTEEILRKQTGLMRQNPPDANKAKKELREEAYKLLALPPGKVKGLTMGTLRSIIEKKGIEELYQYAGGGESGVLEGLQTEVTKIVQEKLGGFPYKTGSGNVKLGPIKMPPDIEMALETAYERKLYTEAVSESLTKLKSAIENFEDPLIRRLADLERLRILAQRGGAYSYRHEEKFAEYKSDGKRNGRNQSNKR